MRTSLWIVALWGCPEPKIEDSVPEDTEDTTTEDTEDTGGVPLTASLYGVVRDAQEEPVAGAQVNVCRDVCRTVTTDETGQFEFPALEAWAASFYVIPDGSELMPAIVPLTFSDGVTIEHDPILFEGQTTPLPDTATEIEVADGLYLTVGADDLEAPAFEKLGDELRGVKVDLDDAMPIDLEDPIVGVWYLTPFEATAADGLPMKVANTFGLVTGDTVDVWAASNPSEYAWLEVGTLTVDDSGLWLEGDAKLPILTTVVLTMPL